MTPYNESNAMLGAPTAIWKAPLNCRVNAAAAFYSSVFVEPANKLPMKQAPTHPYKIYVGAVVKRIDV